MNTLGAQTAMGGCRLCNDERQNLHCTQKETTMSALVIILLTVALAALSVPSMAQ
ncbi:MAG: hypothetical protein KDE19_02130 [Caldilineaceae bacterium]|nr:hypothetical protein [Caldilineaceae bacterium]